MLDDHPSGTGELPVLRVYDRRDVEAYLAAVEDEAAELERRLDAARRRRAAAEHQVLATAAAPLRVVPDLAEATDESTAALAATLAELQLAEAEHQATLVEIRERSLADARRVLLEAEAQVLALRGALQGVLDELETGHADVDVAPVLALVPDLGLDLDEELVVRDHPGAARPGGVAAHPAAHAGLHAVGHGPSLAG